ncbi:hypothetical protein QBC37DRAFT_341076 [Rhypophila decipiens]|uniref:protein disulfide-isomerase n=1 Tax=Rhypophila decipiens TaxID=261697 RepID=A0AAN6Y920_9PEZI|nr:hypothetical protein QBC37DRAFT_341076 [Rhypophila decipiens]
MFEVIPLGVQSLTEYLTHQDIHPEDQGSQALETEWSNLIKMATLGTPSIRAGKISSIDCTASAFFQQLCQEEHIKSYPTIRLYRHESIQAYERYRGPHKASPIMAFLRRSLKPSVSTVDEENVADFTASDYIVFVGSFAAGDETRAKDRYQEAAVRYRDRFSFGLKVEGPEKNKEEMSKVTCWNNLDDEKHETTRLETRELLEAFVKLCSTPLIPEMTRRNELSFYEKRKSIVHYFTRNDRERDDYVKQIRPLARKYRDYLHFTTTDVNEYPDAPEMMGLEWGSSKGLSVQNPNNGDIYPYTGGQTLSASVVELFLSEIIQGKVKPLARGPGGDSSGNDDDDEAKREHEEL